MKRNIIVVLILIALAVVAYALSQRTTVTPTAHTYNLTEFGIALDIPASLDDLTYEVREPTPGPGKILYLNVNGACTIGAVYQIQKNAIKQSGTPWTEKQLEDAQLPLGTEPARVKEFTDFYLVFEPSQDPCSADADKAAEESEKRLALWNAIVTAHYMSY